MSVVLDVPSLPEKGLVKFKVDRSFNIKITADEARRRVNHWLHEEVSYLIRGLSPTLVIGERIVWRVAASLGLPHLGQVGTVGTIEVDVETGQMTNTPECKTKLEHSATELAAYLPSYQPRNDMPAEYVAKHAPIVPPLLLPSEER